MAEEDAQPDWFEFPGLENPASKRMEDLAAFINGEVLGNTERAMLRKLAEKGGPLALVMKGMVAYSEYASYTIGRLDLEDPEQLAKAIELVRERKMVDYQKRFWERALSFRPEEKKEEQS